MVTQQEFPIVVREYAERARKIDGTCGVWHYPSSEGPIVYTVIDGQSGKSVLDTGAALLKAIHDCEKSTAQRFAQYPILIRQLYKPGDLVGLLGPAIPAYIREGFSLPAAPQLMHHLDPAVVEEDLAVVSKYVRRIRHNPVEVWWDPWNRKVFPITHSGHYRDVASSLWETIKQEITKRELGAEVGGTIAERVLNRGLAAVGPAFVSNGLELEFRLTPPLHAICLYSPQRL